MVHTPTSSPCALTNLRALLSSPAPALLNAACHAYQFYKRPLTEIDHLGTQYDYSSVMHYPSTAFSRNGRPTIQPKQAGVTIGHRSGLSQTDAYKINALYGCSTSG
ncbi:unnamed protein product [Toxocara canis]|uniref:Metalloendopeptidase n=1 Tax=Toxocara canis TaxID=6265 RepID=A0A183URG0_TOXCA|nr:unnamed protein product [Toxocara canis]